MKIVLDTNVIVSGLLSPFNSPGEIVRMTASGTLKVCYDSRIISEYLTVLKRPKFKLDLERVNEFILFLKLNGILVSPLPLKSRLPDIDDEPFLEVAIAGNASYLITGNLSHYPENLRQSIAAISPKEFIEIYRNNY